MLTAVLLVLGSVASVSYGREYNCSVDASLCTGSGARSVTVNGVTMCCPHHASISLNNNNCLCTEASNGHDCLVGPQGCREANSFSTDPNGQLRCCLPGYHMTSASTTEPSGQTSYSCTCSPGGQGGGVVSSFLGMSGMPGLSAFMRNGMMMMSSSNNNNNGGVSGAQNRTEIQEQWRKMGNEWKNWGQQFARGFQTWGRNFGQNMRNTGLDLARDLSGVLQTTLTRTTVPVQRALNGLVGNLFRSIPGY